MPYKTENWTHHLCRNRKETMLTYIAANLCHDYCIRPYGRRTCRNQNRAGPPWRPSSPESLRGQEDQHQHPRIPDRRRPRKNLSRYRTTIAQGQKPTEGTVGELRHGDVPDKLCAGMFVEDVMGIIQQDRWSHHDQKATTFEGRHWEGAMM